MTISLFTHNFCRPFADPMRTLSYAILFLGSVHFHSKRTAIGIFNEYAFCMRFPLVPSSIAYRSSHHASNHTPFGNIHPPIVYVQFVQLLVTNIVYRWEDHHHDTTDTDIFDTEHRTEKQTHSMTV